MFTSKANPQEKKEKSTCITVFYFYEYQCKSKFKLFVILFFLKFFREKNRIDIIKKLINQNFHNKLIARR